MTEAFGIAFMQVWRDLVNQGGRVPPGVPGQPMTNFGIWLRRLLTGGEANSPYRAQTVHPHLSLTRQIPEIRQPSVPAHLGERWLLKTIPAICMPHFAIYFAESLFQTRSRSNRCPEAVHRWNSLSAGQ